MALFACLFAWSGSMLSFTKGMTVAVVFLQVEILL
jgi:hypothetical protein